MDKLENRLSTTLHCSISVPRYPSCLHPFSPKFGRTPRLDRIQSKLANIWLDVGRVWTKSCRVRNVLLHIWSISFQIRPGSRQIRPEFRRNLANPVQHRASSASFFLKHVRVWDPFGREWRSLPIPASGNLNGPRSGTLIHRVFPNPRMHHQTRPTPPANMAKGRARVLDRA